MGRPILPLLALCCSLSINRTRLRSCFDDGCNDRFVKLGMALSGDDMNLIKRDGLYGIGAGMEPYHALVGADIGRTKQVERMRYPIGGDVIAMHFLDGLRRQAK